MKKCTKRFLFFTLELHKFEEIYFFSKSKIIGKVPEEWEEGSFKKITKQYSKKRCKICRKTKTSLEHTLTEIFRRYNRP